MSPEQIASDPDIDTRTDVYALGVVFHQILSRRRLAQGDYLPSAADLEIMGVHRMTGELDYLIRARVAHMADYDRLYQLLVSRVALSDVSASFVMEDIKDTHHLPL